jgi:hypothetical protein
MNTIIIGNGPSILSKELGGFIDKTETVVRINKFHIKGFEKHVGTKTDIWAVNMGYLIDNSIIWTHDFPQPKTIIFAPYSITEYSNYKDCQKSSLSKNEFLCDVNISKKMDMYYDKKNSIWPSTGIYCIMQFLPCYIIGFDNFLSNIHHYGDNDSFFKHHNGKFEKSFIDSLSHYKKIIIL